MSEMESFKFKNQQALRMLKQYNQKFLELAHFLALNKTFMNHSEVASAFAKHKQISERTVRRWLKVMQKHCFDYFPGLCYECLGLRWVSVIIEDVKDYGFLKMLPHLAYTYPSVNFQNFKRSFLLGYLIPEGCQKKLEKIFEYAKEKNLIDDYVLFITKTPMIYSYAPFHDVIDSDGNLHFAGEHDNTYFTGLLKENLEQDCDCRMRDEIKKNPLVIPILFEYLREHWSSKKVWFNAKQKLKTKVWDYTRSVRKRTDAAGIKLVQEAHKLINRHANIFFKQTRVVYSPMHDKAAITFLLLKPKNYRDVPEFCERVSKNSLITGICQSSNKSVLGLYIVTSVEKLTKIIGEIVPLYTSRNFKPKALWLNREESNYYWKSRLHMKFDYSKVFDPKKCEWIYEHGKYMAELRKL